MRRLLIAQLGARRNYAVPRALYRAGVLDTLVTDACADVPPWRWLGKLVPECRRGDRLRRLLGRSVPQVPPNCIAGLPLIALQGLQKPRRGERRTDYWARRNAAFCRAVLRRGFGNADTVYAFNGCALEVFRQAKQLGLRTILDQTAAPWRWNARLLREEIARWPGWEDRPVELDESGVLSDREDTEWELADVVVCGSHFCRSTLLESGLAAEKCHLLPPPVTAPRAISPALESGPQPGSVRVLFAGTLQLRKGLPYLYEAARRLRGKSIEFRLVGPSMLSDEANSRLAEYCDLRGAVPRSVMAEHYRWADILVLPTLSEGSANVCHEAMAAGLSVITTPAAGSMVRDRSNGLIVPVRDAGALAEAIGWMAGEPETRRRLGRAAREAVYQTRDTDSYSAQLASIFEHIPRQLYESQVSLSSG